MSKGRYELCDISVWFHDLLYQSSATMALVTLIRMSVRYT